jgi:hypothetical protein
MILLIVVALSQLSTPLNLNGQAITKASCDGGITCTKTGQTLTIVGSGSAGPGGSSDFDGGYNVVQDEGIALTKRTTINFTGSAVSCTDTGSITECSITGGGGGGNIHAAAGNAYFDGGSLDAYTTVTAVWSSSTHTIVCRPTGEESSVEGAQTTVLSQSTGSFVVRTEPRQGSHHGNLPFVCLGH